MLYEFSPRNRTAIIASVLRALEPPDVAIVSEPHRELHLPGRRLTIMPGPPYVPIEQVPPS